MVGTAGCLPNPSNESSSGALPRHLCRGAAREPGGFFKTAAFKEHANAQFDHVGVAAVLDAQACQLAFSMQDRQPNPPPFTVVAVLERGRLQAADEPLQLLESQGSGYAIAQVTIDERQHRGAPNRRG
jgi:hypothetical protein